MNENDNLPTITDDDLREVGFPDGMKMAAGLQIFLVDSLFKRCSSIAVRMAQAAKEGVLPKHLADRPAACFAIVSRAITWNLDPFAVAQCTYETPGGRVGYEGKLVQAVLENSGHLDGGVKFELGGDWSRVKGKFKIIESQKGGKYPSPTWTAEDAKGLYVVVSAKLKGEAVPRSLRFDLDEAFPLNSPLWATSPNRQIRYTAVRAFANLELPSVLMGVPFDVDPVSFYGEPMPPTTDITPRKEPAQGKGNEFERASPRKDAEFKADTLPPETKANGQDQQAQAETQSTPAQETASQVNQTTETRPPETEQKPNVDKAPAAKVDEPAKKTSETRPAQVEEQADLLTDADDPIDPAVKRREAAEDHLSDCIKGLATEKHVRDVTETYKDKLSDFSDYDDLKKRWYEACKTRQKAIMDAAGK